MKINQFAFIGFFLLLGDAVFGQCIEAEYKILVEREDLPAYIDMSRLDMRMKTCAIPNYTLLETFLGDDAEIFKAGNDDVRFTYINKEEKKIFQFTIDSTYIDGSSLKTDTLVKTSNPVTKYGYECETYFVKNHENIKVYATVKLDRLINPGINYFVSEKSIGGIVAIEITYNNRKIHYMLTSYDNGNQSNIFKIQKHCPKQNVSGSREKSILQY